MDLVELERKLFAAIDAGDVTTIDELGALVDELQAQRPKVTPLQAALWYAEQGLKVFPLQPDSKAPHPKTHGCLEATSDADTIRAWWERWPDSNVAIATGHLVDVIDVDGPTGVKSWSELIEANQLPPILGHVCTIRPGGNHLYIGVTGGGNRTNIRPGVDTRGKGGYVVAPPSTINGKKYTWLTPLNLGGNEAA